MENKKIWFKAKRFGWGWYPVSWQGWAVTILYVTPITQFAILVNNETHSASDFLINYSLPFIINTIFLLIICYAHGEKPQWHWGN